MKKWKIIFDEIFKQNALSHKKHCYTLFYLYMIICNNKKLRVREIEDLEKIVFLSQCYSLKVNNHSMLEYKTYIYDNHIYLKYLSDLFRVMPLKEVNSSPFGKDMRRGRRFEYDKILNKFSKLNEEELNSQYNQAINNINNNKYFVNHKCEYTIMRLLARHAAWSEAHMSTLIKTILSWLVSALVLTWVSYIVAICLYFLGIHMGILDLDLLPILCLSLLCIPSWIIWTSIIMKPTNFELSRGYDKAL